MAETINCLRIPAASEIWLFLSISAASPGSSHLVPRLLEQILIVFQSQFSQVPTCPPPERSSQNISFFAVSFQKLHCFSEPYEIPNNGLYRLTKKWKVHMVNLIFRPVFKELHSLCSLFYLKLQFYSVISWCNLFRFLRLFFIRHPSCSTWLG